MLTIAAVTSHDGDVEEGHLFVGEWRFDVKELEDVEAVAAVVRVVKLAFAVLQVLVALVVDALVRREAEKHVVDLQWKSVT